MAYTTEENESYQEPELTTEEYQSGLTSLNLEILFDFIAQRLIESPFVNKTIVENNQTFIRNGKLEQGAGEGVLALFQKDLKANEADLNQTTTLDTGETISQLQNIINQVVNVNTLNVAVLQGQDESISISLVGGGLPDGAINITNLIIGDGNPLNVSQFIPINQKQSNVDIDKAEEFLDTNIFELLPSGDTRQSRIIRFFQELNALLPPNPPEFDLDNDNRVDRGTDNNWTGSLQYSQDNSISYAQDNTDGNIDEEDAFIHRLKSTANDTNSTRTIEDIYNTIFPYLTDMLEDEILPQDDRPTYQNQSSGYLKFRNLNQGIIIRNTNQEFVQGLNPNNLTYLDDGFTITMWVRFLDKVSTGTLFNFGNPTRGQDDPNWNRTSEEGFGFKLETFIVNKDDRTGWGSTEPGDNNYTFGSFSDSLINNNRPDGYISKDSNKPIFGNTDSARFVRLVVNAKDTNGDGNWLRSSEAGNSAFTKYTWNLPELPGNFNPDNQQWDELLALGATHIPEDFNEWYFICATYNPNIIEPDKYNVFGDNESGLNPIYDAYKYDFDFWMNRKNPDQPDTLVANSGYGNQCKVEIISRTDLLKARGFKV